MPGSEERPKSNEANRGLTARARVGPAVDGLGLHDGAVTRPQGVRLKPRN